MVRQHILAAELLITDVTREELWLFMHRLDVRFESILSGKFIATLRTRECILASVMEHMRSQLGRLDETFRTKCAFVRSFARVDFHVTIQRLFRGESAVALRMGIGMVTLSMIDSGIDRHSTHTIGQAYGFSPVCDRRCLRSAPFDGNDFSQRSHGNGFSPV